MVALSLFWRLTHTKRYAAKAKAIRTENREMMYMRESPGSIINTNLYVIIKAWRGCPGYAPATGIRRVFCMPYCNIVKAVLTIISPLRSR